MTFVPRNPHFLQYSSRRYDVKSWRNLKGNLGGKSLGHLQSFDDLIDLFTARKRSLGQGNIFTNVCQEFCSRGGGGGGSDPLRAGIPPPFPGKADPPLCAVHAGRYGQQAGGMHPTGMQSC